MNVGIGVFRACAGGYVGGGQVHPALVDAAREGLAQAKESGLVADGFVARCGDDIDLVLMHTTGQSRQSARSIANDIFGRAATAGARLHQHGGNGGVEVDGVEMSLGPRPSEPVLCLFSNKAGRAVWNTLLYRLFADPLNTPGLFSDAALAAGFTYVVGGEAEAEEVFELPADLYRLFGALRAGGQILQVRARASGEVAAVVSPGRDPTLVVRCESPFPAVEDALEAFTSTCGCQPSLPPESLLVPVSANGDASARSFPRAIGLGFQVAPDRLVGPRDLLGDASFDDIRRAILPRARAQGVRAPVGPAVRQFSGTA